MLAKKRRGVEKGNKASKLHCSKATLVKELGYAST